MTIPAILIFKFDRDSIGTVDLLFFFFFKLCMNLSIFPIKSLYSQLNKLASLFLLESRKLLLQLTTKKPFSISLFSLISKRNEFRSYLSNKISIQCGFMYQLSLYLCIPYLCSDNGMETACVKETFISSFLFFT